MTTPTTPPAIDWREALANHAAAARGAGLNECRVRPWLLEGAAAEMVRLRDAAEAGFWYLAYTLRSHMFRTPRAAFDMRAFAPEAREFCNAAEQRLYDACAAIAGVRHG